MRHVSDCLYGKTFSTLGYEAAPPNFINIAKKGENKNMIWQVLFGTVGETIGRKAKYVTFIGIKKYQAKTLQYCLQEHVFKCPQAESFSLHRENHPGPQQPISLKHCYLGSLEMCLLAFKTLTSTKRHIRPPFDGNQCLWVYRLVGWKVASIQAA